MCAIVRTRLQEARSGSPTSHRGRQWLLHNFPPRMMRLVRSTLGRFGLGLVLFNWKESAHSWSHEIHAANSGKALREIGALVFWWLNGFRGDHAFRTFARFGGDSLSLAAALNGSWRNRVGTLHNDRSHLGSYCYRRLDDLLHHRLIRIRGCDRSSDDFTGAGLVDDQCIFDDHEDLGRFFSDRFSNVLGDFIAVRRGPCNSASGKTGYGKR